MSGNSPAERKRVSAVVRWLLFIYAFVFGIYMGGGIFETVVVTPMWSASADAARRFNMDPLHVVPSGNFFFVIAPLCTLLSIVTLIAGWRTAQPVRFWLRIAIIPFLIIFAATMYYYVPEQAFVRGALTDGLSDAEITERGRRWVLLNWARFLIAFALWGATLHALGLAYRSAGTSQPAGTS